mgnify:CR=1 FL=1
MFAHVGAPLAEAKFRLLYVRNDQEVIAAADQHGMAMVFTDAKEPEHPIIFANDSFLSLTGYDREEALGKSFNFLMANDADAEALA